MANVGGGRGQSATLYVDHPLGLCVGMWSERSSKVDDAAGRHYPADSGHAEGHNHDPMMLETTLAYDDAEHGEIEIRLDPASAGDVVRGQVRRLDGRRRTLVTIRKGDAHLGVGGDGESGLVVYASFDDRTFYQLVSRSAGPVRAVEIVAGGQPGKYQREHVVGRDDAIHAAHVFAATGRLADDLRWAET